MSLPNHAADRDQHATADALLVDEPTTRRILGGLSARTLFNYRRDGLLPYVKVGSRTFYRPADLERFVAERRQGGGP